MNAGNRYQPDSGPVTAQNYWLCAWLWRYLDSPPAARSQSRTAATELVKYQRMDAYTRTLDNRGRQAVDGAIVAAGHGVRTTVESFTKASCGGPFYSHARGGASAARG